MSVELYQALMDRVSDALLLLSDDGTVLASNRSVARLGFAPQPLEGCRLSDLVVEPPEVVAEYVRNCLASRAVIRKVFLIRRSDDSRVRCRLNGRTLKPALDPARPLIVVRAVVKSASGGPFGALNRKIVRLGHEIARRKRTEEALRQEKERLDVTLSSIGDAVITTDAEGQVTFLNPVAEALCGWPAAEAVGRPLRDVFKIINESSRLPAENPVDLVLSARGVVGFTDHTLLVARDGRETPVDDSAAPIADADGRIRGIVLVFRDISSRRKAAEISERLAAIVESSDDIIASKNLDGILTSWNAGAERVLGYSADEVIGRHVSMLMPPEQIEDIERILGRIRRGEKVDHYESKRRRKDGTIIDVSLTVSPIRDPEGRIIGASKIGRDISREKQIEAERLDAERRKDEFLAMLAHELRNPLSAINGAAQLLGRLETENELEWAKDVVLRQVKHLARLIDDLLDVSRISRGKIGLRKERIDLAPVVASAVEAVRPLMEERKHELTVSLVNGGLRLDADPLRLEQILINLLNNAAKYTDAGGRISLSARVERDELTIRVRDNGMGITPELLPHIFDLFAQGDRTVARSEGGLGIGLTLVQKLAEMHGGSVAVRSEGPGQGSEFTVRLPARLTAIESLPSSHDSPRRQAQKSSRVLVVDDNADSAGGLSKLLRLLGHDVKVANDGVSAVELAKVHRPEVILLDIGLPGMDGYEVARRLRQDECCADALIIAVSGYGQPEDLRRSTEAGFDHHLVKPVDYDMLMTMFASR